LLTHLFSLIGECKVKVVYIQLTNWRQDTSIHWLNSLKKSTFTLYFLQHLFQY